MKDSLIVNYPNIDLSNCKVKQHSSKYLKLVNRFISINRYCSDAKEYENLLSKLSGHEKDNHTIYEVTFENGHRFYVVCSDGHMSFGLGFKKHNS